MPALCVGCTDLFLHRHVCMALISRTAAWRVFAQRGNTPATGRCSFCKSGLHLQAALRILTLSFFYISVSGCTGGQDGPLNQT